MKLPFTIDLRNLGAKQLVGYSIASHGKSKVQNQVGIPVQCVAETSNPFEILAFNAGRHMSSLGAANPLTAGTAE